MNRLELAVPFIVFVLALVAGAALVGVLPPIALVDQVLDALNSI
jgi:hypothetical protein